MKNLIDFFFSFDKLMKEKLVLLFFWLAVIAAGMFFFAEVLDKISLGILASIVNFFEFFVTILLTLVFIRLISELAVSIFRINDNLSPDGGKSETANIDPMAEARKVAEAAAERAREVTKAAGEKTQAATKSARESMSGMASNVSDKTKFATNDAKKTASKAGAAKTTPVKKTPSRKTAPLNPASKSKASKTRQVKPQVSSASSTRKITPTIKTTTKPAAVKLKSSAKAPMSNSGALTTSKKRGPKPGVKVRRDDQGRLLKKDGTLRAKPGPKK